jgi:twitching motility protein PilT
MITDVIEQGAIHYGMQTFDQSLFSLYRTGLITYEEALRRATNPDDFILRVKGIQSTSELSIEEQLAMKPEKPAKPEEKDKMKIERFSR